MKEFLKIFGNNKWFKLALLAVFVQQVIVALGTYFLGQLSSEYPTEGFKFTTAELLFICIFLPGTIVHYWISWCITRAHKLAQWCYIDQYANSNYNNPTHWRNDKSKNQRHDIMCREGQDSVHSAVSFFIDSVATGLNILLNTASIILVTDFVLGVIILIAGFLGLWIIYLFENGISETSRNEMNAENQLNALLSRSWDNIILGNQLFFVRWKEFFKQYFVTSERAALQTVKKRDWAIAVAGMVTNGLVLGGALGLAWLNRNSAGFVLAILVMLPRCLQIVMHIQIIQTYVARWKSLKEKLVVTQESLSILKPLDLSSHIKADDISIKFKDKKFSITDIEMLLKNHQAGRFTITGPNGSGKSNMLLRLKDTLSSSSVYLPPQHQLMLKEAQLCLSSGEIALAALNDLQSEKYSVFLLDEWDANLSANNRAALDQIIDQLSINRVVIEVRHPHQN